MSDFQHLKQRNTFSPMQIAFPRIRFNVNGLKKLVKIYRQISILHQVEIPKDKYNQP